jgi:hypothetical protein
MHRERTHQRQLHNQQPRGNRLAQNQQQHGAQRTTQPNDESQKSQSKETEKRLKLTSVERLKL